jgi:hypothetical protein
MNIIYNTHNLSKYFDKFDINIGNSICPIITSLLNKFFNIKILNITEFTKDNNYYPYVSSCFIVSDGGSYDYVIDNKKIVIYNGSLHSIEGVPELSNYLNKYQELITNNN